MTDRQFNKVQTNFGLDKYQVGQMSRSNKRPGRTNVTVGQTSRSDKRPFLALGRTNVAFLALGRTNVDVS
jgi:hypothetical protein